MVCFGSSKSPKSPVTCSCCFVNVIQVHNLIRDCQSSPHFKGLLLTGLKSLCQACPRAQPNAVLMEGHPEERLLFHPCASVVSQEYAGKEESCAAPWCSLSKIHFIYLRGRVTEREAETVSCVLLRPVFGRFCLTDWRFGIILLTNSFKKTP